MKTMKKNFLSLCFLLFGINLNAKVVISQIMYDTPLNEQITEPPYSNGEFVEIYNAGAYDELLSNWKIAGGGVSEVLAFPEGLLLASGQSLIIAYRHYNSEGFILDSLFPSESTGLHYDIIYQRKIILNNTGEPLKLIKPNGIIEDSVYYTNIASNNSATPYYECRSIHRSRISLNMDGSVHTDINDWSVGMVCRGCDSPLEEFLYTPSSSFSDSLPSNFNYRIVATPLDTLSELSLKEGHVSPNASSRIRIACDVFDGLGRQQQSVIRRNSSDLCNTAALTEQDARYVVTDSWLPVPYKGDSFLISTLLKSNAISYYEDSYPYASTTYEASPLSRETASTIAGSVYQPHPATIEYGTNMANEVIRWAVSSDEIIGDSYYPQGSLSKTTTTNEDGKKVIVYKDYQDRLILQKQGNDTLWAYTYFVYDAYSRLTYVLPPEIVTLMQTNLFYTESHPLIKRYAYIYHYDSRDMLTYKKMPGCEPIWMIYDKAEKLILSQDGNQRTRGNFWIYNAYDETNRLLYQAEVRLNNASYATLTQAYKALICRESFASDTAYNYLCYTTTYVTADSIKPLYAYYYDDYNFINNLPQGAQNSLNFLEDENYDTKYENTVRMTTGMRVYNLSNNLSAIHAYYYDHNGNIVQSHSINPDSGVYAFYAKYNHDGTISRSKEINNDHTELSTYHYDHMGRVRKHEYQLDENPQITLTHNFYDSIGRLVQNLLHNGQMNNRFVYDMRNNLSALQSGPFLETIYRAENIPSNMDSLFDGSISAITDNYPSSYVAYRFHYDGLSRLTQSHIESDGNWIPSELFSYDLQGNILTLQRYDGNGLIDDISLLYDGNQVYSIEESAATLADDSRYGYTDRCHYDTTIRYDANGNIAMDLDRNIVAVEYNILNLPKSITFNTGSRIINEYNAKGEKLSSTFIGLQQPRIKICYNKNHEITYLKTSEALEFTKIKEVVYNNEGYYQYLFNETSPQVSQYYYCRNYLGSNVAVWNANTKQVEQQTMYYATGLPMNNSTGEDVQTHKYNGKEYISQFGLNEYDSQARYYYSTIARTTTMDPLAEKYYHISPYAWCGNNPVNAIDIGGMKWFYYPRSSEEDVRPEYFWEDVESYIYTKNDGTIISLPGYDAIVVFEGSRSERFGIINGQKYLSGEDAVLADVTIYGPQGEDDIVLNLVGFTMTSDYEKYGAIADGFYNGNYDAKGMSSSAIKSNWVLENRGKIPTLDNLPNPYRESNYFGLPFKDGIFIHSTLTSSNKVGSRTSVGCLLLDWESMQLFNDRMKGVNKFGVHVIRK